jgi:trehalose 6-phosphate synthase
MNNRRRLLVVSNRLPFTIESSETGKQLCPSNGGLVSALTPILSESRGCWIGWPGSEYDAGLLELLQDWESTQNYSFIPVFLTAAERDCYYRGFSNQIIWPLFHSLPSRCQFDPLYWNGYCTANDKFAEAVARVSERDDFIWIHDYHLMLAAQALRRRGLSHRLAYFHHIPFPSCDIFETLPWRVDVLRAMMRFNVLGFQTVRDRRNFIGCVRRCLRGVRVSRIGDSFLVRSNGLSVTVMTHPISIDYDAFEAEASEPETVFAAQGIQRGLGGTRIILGVDRLDYTKGIPERLAAFQRMLETNPSLRGRVTMVQQVMPSREDIPEYKQLRLRIETLVSKINGEYSAAGWVPVHYLYRSIPRSELVAFYRAADIAMVTPLKDGMNLIGKEFCASRVDNRGVLVLSEFAGAADELRNGALVVNPHDTERVALVLTKALDMNESEQQIRMEKMRAYLRVHDVFHWFRSFHAESSVGIKLPELDSVQWPTSAAAGY